MLTSWRLRGIVTFSFEGFGTEYMFLYTADGFEGTLRDCDEGNLEWVRKSQVCQLPIWEGDEIFFRLLERGRDFFSLKLCYDRDCRLQEAVLDGRLLSGDFL